MIHSDPASLTDLKIHGLTEELLKDLNRAFPERCPSVGDSERDIWVYTGKRELVRYLQQQLKVSQSALHTHRLPM